MSIWGRMGDRFTQGYALGERISERLDKQDEADAMSALIDAQGKAKEAVPTEGYEWSPDRPPETMSDGSMPLNLEKAVPTDMGGPMRRENGMASEGVSETASTGFVRSQKLDPQYADNIRSARAALYKAAAQRDPSRALMLQEYFVESDRRQAMQMISSAVMAGEMGDQQAMIENALGAYNLVNDGANAQVRKVGGNLVAVSYDKESGKYRGAMLLTPDGLAKMGALIANDPMAWRQMNQADEQLAMQRETHGLGKRRAEQELEKGEWEKEHRDELFGVQLEAQRAAITLKNKMGAYYDALAAAREGATPGSIGMNAGWGATVKEAGTNWRHALGRLDSTVKSYVENSAGIDADSTEGKMVSDPATVNSAKGIASDIMWNFGPTVPPERAFAAALKLKGIEHELATLPEDAMRDRLNEQAQSVQIENDMVVLTIDGMKIPLDNRYSPGIVAGLEKVLAPQAEAGDENAQGILDHLARDKASAGEVAGRAVGMGLEHMQRNATDLMENPAALEYLNPMQALWGLSGRARQGIGEGLSHFATGIEEELE